MFGGGKLGGTTLGASSLATLPFAALPKGRIKTILLTIALSLKSSATAFAAVVSTGSSAAAEAVDDMDLLLNALFTSLALYWEADNPAFQLTPAQLRTVLGLFNQRDFDGSFLNGVSVPVSSGAATAFKIVIPIPVALDYYFRDGNVFSNGSKRLSEGRMEFQVGSSLTPSVVLANGTAVVSALSINVTTEHDGGSESDVGNTWRISRKTSLPNPYEAQDAYLRLALLDTDPSSTNAATSYNAGEYANWAPADFQGVYQAERLRAGGFDLTARCTPLDWLRDDTTVNDFPQHMGKASRIEIISGKTTMNAYEVVAVPPTPSALATVSNKVGGGGPVSIEHPSPRSIPPGTAIAPAVQAFLPRRIFPGNTSSGTGSSERHANPTSAAIQQAAKETVARRGANVLRRR